MRIIVGLGNPGGRYSGTRHNVGFEAVDRLAFENKIAINKAKHRAHIGEGFVNNNKVLLVKPQTYMNLSGDSVIEILRYYKCGTEDVIVIYDDTDLRTGEIRIREKGSAGGHNGIKSIIERLETDAFVRVRIGIGQKPNGWDLADYVLSQFKKEETDDLEQGITRAVSAVSSILSDGVAVAMNRFNGKTARG